MMPPESEAFQIVSVKVQERMPAFAQLGLEFETAYVEPSKLTSSTLWFRFKKAANSYEVTIAFATVRGGRGGLFEAFIERPDHVSLSIKTYLHFHAMSLQEGLFCCEEDVPDFAIFVDAFLTSLVALLTGRLKAILDGVAWESIPVDLSPYK